MPHSITVVDSGTGNLHTVRRRLARLGVEVDVTADPESVRRAVKVVLPGVGHFDTAMTHLERSGLVEALHEAAHVRGVPVLGICLGMHLMAARSEEGTADGLGWIDADVVRFTVRDTLAHKVPHIGWNRVAVRRASPIFHGIATDAEFYFVHSYHLRLRAGADLVGETEYDYPFPSAVQRENLYGVQFHPEKSHGVGDTMLRNFVAL